MTFSKNWNKKWRGLLQTRFNGKLFWTSPWFVRHQEGLSISPLCTEKSISKVNLMPRSPCTESWTIRGTQFRPKFDSFRIGFCRTPDFDWVHMNRSKSIIFPLFFIMIETDGQSSREKVISNRNRHILKSQVYLPGLVTNLIGISPDSVEPTKHRPQTLCGLIDHQELMRTS